MSVHKSESSDSKISMVKERWKVLGLRERISILPTIALVSGNDAISKCYVLCQVLRSQKSMLRSSACCSWYSHNVNCKQDHNRNVTRVRLEIYWKQ